MAHPTYSEPLKYCDQPPVDLLDRGALVQAMADELFDAQDCPNGQVIGLYGSWGAGKTFVLNCLLNECLRRNKPERPIHLIPCLFQAWRYELEGDLAPGLIRSLSGLPEQDYITNMLPGFEHEDFRKDMRTRARKLLSSIELVVKMASVAAPPLAALIDVAKGLEPGDGYDPLLAPVDRVHEQMGDLVRRILATAQKQVDNENKALAQTERSPQPSIKRSYRLVIFVDDLDRCSPENMVRLFEWLKNHLLVEECVYVLAIDHVAAARAIVGRYREYLGESHDLAYGFRYLEKLIDSEYELEQSSLVQHMAIKQIYGEQQTLVDITRAIAGGDFNGITFVDDLLKLRCLGTPRTTLKIINKFRRAMKVIQSPAMTHMRNTMVSSHPFWTLFMITVYYQLGPDEFFGFVQGSSPLYEILANRSKSSMDTITSGPLADFRSFALEFQARTRGTSLELPDDRNRQLLSRLIRENALPALQTSS